MLWTTPLNMINVVSVAFAIVAACLIYVITMFADPLRKIPGPFIARFTRLWELRRVLEGHFERTNLELHGKYGTRNL